MQSLQDHRSDWLADLKTQGRAKLTLDTYGRVTRDFLASLPSAEVKHLTRAAVRSWLTSLNDLKLSSQRGKFGALHAWCNWLVAEGVIPENPMKGIRRPVARAEPKKPFTDEEIESLLAACPMLTRRGGASFHGRRDKAIILVLMCGLRIHECAKIELDHIDLDQRVIVVQGKGGKWRTVPYDERTARALKSYMRARARHRYADSPRLWLGEKVPELNVSGVDHMLKRKAETAGVDNVHAHRFRHTATSRMLDAGVSETSVQLIFGWSGQQMMQHYSLATAADRALREFHERMNKSAPKPGAQTPRPPRGQRVHRLHDKQGD